MTDREFADNLNLIRKGDQTGLRAVYEEYMSYIYSVLLTLGFGIAVNLVMYFRLKKIPMVESLKSVE